MAATAAATVLVAASAQAQPAAQAQALGATSETPLIRWNPAIRQGRLPNGLRYAVQHNASPKGAVSLRLGIAVGSYDEADDERGVAHFVEHMGFNGTRSFAQSELDSTFAPLGVTFGRDHNAGTDFKQTIYELDLPTTDPKDVAAAVRWLRDVADGMLFPDANVVRERGVIQAERATRQGAFEDLREQMSAFQDGALRSATRVPIGTEASIAAMTPSRLKSFYDRWYRPENAAVVIVGDLPVDALEAQVRTAFGDWIGRGAAGVRASRTPPAAVRGPDVRLATNPRAPAVVAMCRLTPPEAASPQEARLRTALMRQVWTAVLQARFESLKAKPDPAFIRAEVEHEERPDTHKTCVTILPAKGREAQAIAAISAEVRRFDTQGPTEAEADAGIEEVRSRVRGGVNGEAHLSKAAAAEILETALDDMQRLEPREGLKAYDTLMEGVDAAALKAAFARDWSGSGPLVAVATPEPVAESAVRLALAGSKDAPSAQLAAAPEAKWGYVDFGAPGKVVKRQEIAAPGFVRLQFANGVILNFKRNAYDGQAVSVRVRFGRGREEIAPADLMSAQFAAGLFKEGGLGRNSYEEIAGRLRNSAWDANLTIGDQAFWLSGGTTSTSLDDQLNVLAAYLSDPGFRPSLDSQIAVMTDTLYRSYASIPGLLIAETMAEAVTPGQPNNLPPREQLTALRSTDFARVLKPLMTTSPLEVTVVGDIDEKTAIAAVASSLGALPARPPRINDVKPWFMRFPQTLPAPVYVHHQGSREQTLMGVYWPLYVANPGQRQEEYALALLAGVMRDQLRHRIREQLGMTYAPDAETRMPDFADQGYLLATVETRPADAEAVLKELRAMAERLARGEITPEALEATRTPMLTRLAAAESSNDWWAALLTFSTGDAGPMHDLMERRTRIAALTLDDVKRAAATWLSRQPLVVVAAPTPEPPKGAAK